jgi:hypothetical protein
MRAGQVAKWYSTCILEALSSIPRPPHTLKQKKVR